MPDASSADPDPHRRSVPDVARKADVESCARLDALELQAMDAEVAQAVLDAVVIRHGDDIAHLQRTLQALSRRVDALANQSESTAAGCGEQEAGLSLSDSLARELPPHY